MNKLSKLLFHLFILLIILIGLTLLIAYFNLDLKLEQNFYKDGSWFLAKVNPWRFLYVYGTYPGIILAGAYILLLIGSYSIKKLVPLRKEAILILLTLIIGPGLLINGTFKDHWGRPRPREVNIFGGKWDFREVWEPGIPGKGKSFPCGHCSMGFIFIAFYFAYKKKNSLIRNAAIPVSLTYGVLMGIARMVQGGHFLSDVVWSAGMVYFTVVILYYFIYEFFPTSCIKRQQKNSEKLSNRKLFITILLSIIALSILLWVFLFSKPVYKEYKHSIKSLNDSSIIKLTIYNKVGDINIINEDIEKPCQIETVLNGFGYPRKKIESNLIQNMKDDTLVAHYSLFVDGFFYELTGKTTVRIDTGNIVFVTATTENGDIFHSPSDESSIIIYSNLKAPNGTLGELKQTKE